MDKIENHAILITNPLEFDNFHQNWNKILKDLGDCKMKIIETDFELDAYLQLFFKEGLIPVIDPIFDPITKSLVTGFEIRSREKIISDANQNRKKWQKGDKVKILFPDAVTDKSTGVLLTDEFIDENGVSIAVFQPIENGKRLENSELCNAY